MDASWDPNANSKIRGSVRLTPDGEVRWTTVSIFSGYVSRLTVMRLLMLWLIHGQVVRSAGVAKAFNLVVLVLAVASLVLGLIRIMIHMVLLGPLPSGRLLNVPRVMMRAMVKVKT